MPSGGSRSPAIRAGAVALALALASCGGSGGSSSGRTGEPRPPAPRISLSATTHRPVVGAPWPIAIRAHTAAGRPLRASVRYQFLFAGSVVARRSHHRFRGGFHDTLRWPARSVGVPLTFRAVVVTPLGTRRLDYKVRVRRGGR
jgi:hypothetical protein